MPRTKTDRIARIKEILLERLRLEYFPGARFLTNREIAREYGISYVTAHLMIEEFCQANLLERRSTVGTFVPSHSLAYEKAHLIFNPVAGKDGRFGVPLLRQLIARLDQASIPWKLSWTNRKRNCSRGDYIVLWERENDRIARELSVTGRHGLLLNMPPRPSTLQSFDSVLIDYFAAGVRAGRMLRQQKRCRRAVIAGPPPGKTKTAEIFIRGFRTVWPNARHQNIRKWGSPDRPEILAALAAAPETGICCCFMPRAEEILHYFHGRDLDMSLLIVAAEPPRPPEFMLPFVSVPLNEFVNTAVRIICNRFAGDQSAPAHITLEPRLLLG